MQRQRGNAVANFQGPISGFRDWGLSFQGWGQLGRVGEVGGVTGVAGGGAGGGGGAAGAGVTIITILAVILPTALP